MPISIESPSYKHNPIATPKSLARCLNVDLDLLVKTAESAEKYWLPGKKQRKKDGSIRVTNNARDPLKQIHTRIKDRLLAKVNYPSYILGGIASDKYTHRDYIAHANTHASATLVLSEDIENFFPNTTERLVNDIWQGLFRFTPEVARLLTLLTTYNGMLPQGWITSNHLANLALWRYEQLLHSKLVSMGLKYSRFVDDINVSSDRYLSAEMKTLINMEIVDFIKRCGYRPKRSKHDLSTSGQPMRVVGLNVNGRRASKPKKARHEIRALVDRCEQYDPCARNSEAYLKLWNQASGQVGTLKQLHPIQAGKLRSILSNNRPIRQHKKKQRPQKRYKRPLLGYATTDESQSHRG